MPLFAKLFSAWAPDGRPNWIQVVGNMTGLTNAGAVFGRHWATWLLYRGWLQSVIDRWVFYLFYLRRPDGMMVLCVYVDDNRLKYAFMAALRADFSVNPGATAEDNFLGFQHIRFPDGSLHIYAGGLIDKLSLQ